jgi:hypothetical protein
LREIAHAGSQALREHGVEATEELLDPAAPARADPNLSVGVAQEILDEKRTEVSGRAHDHVAGRRLARHVRPESVITMLRNTQRTIG